jgi:hypothetical protein
MGDYPTIAALETAIASKDNLYVYVHAIAVQTAPEFYNVTHCQFHSHDGDISQSLEPQVYDFIKEELPEGAALYLSRYYSRYPSIARDFACQEIDRIKIVCLDHTVRKIVGTLFQSASALAEQMALSVAREEYPRMLKEMKSRPAVQPSP